MISPAMGVTVFLQQLPLWYSLWRLVGSVITGRHRFSRSHAAGGWERFITAGETGRLLKITLKKQAECHFCQPLFDRSTWIRLMGINIELNEFYTYTISLKGEINGNSEEKKQSSMEHKFTCLFSDNTNHCFQFWRVKEFIFGGVTLTFNHKK